MFKVVEIFKSIDGEGIRSGYPATFIRLHGCSLRCSYCDTSYAYENDAYREMNIVEILDEVEELGVGRITLTGGEPLLHEGVIALIRELILRDFEVNIETNGSVDLSILDKFKDNLNLIVTMDWKCLSSGMSDRMIVSNLSWLRNTDVLKFVVGSTEDLEQMREVLNKNTIYATVFVSPVFGEIEVKDIVSFVLDNNLCDTRVQLQIHKIIYPVDMRGV